MTKLLIIGAGRSTGSLVDYLLQHSAELNLELTVADLDIKLAQEKVQGNNRAKAISLNIEDKEQRQEVIKNHDFIISMLPAFMHGNVAKDCLSFNKHMATASYVSAEMKMINKEAQQNGLLFLNECGLDPGIDHASAMKLIHEIEAKGGTITSFKSYCGGLVAPESNDNPWGYKFSWNPRNVVLAGQGTAQYLKEGKIKYLPYNKLFKQTDLIEIEGYGRFDAYANRDSLSYIDVYGLSHVKTMLRGTLRQEHYCKAYDIFIDLGLTDDSTRLFHTNKLTYTDLLLAFLPSTSNDLKTVLKNVFEKRFDNDIEKMFDYLELFNHKKITLSEGTPAQLLQNLLEEKWKLNETDKDMIVMQHLFEYELNNTTKKVTSSLVVKGVNNKTTAMSKTVGLPLAICVKNFLTKKYTAKGVVIPTVKEIYNPLLAELENYDITFHEKFD